MVGEYRVRPKVLFKVRGTPEHISYKFTKPGFRESHTNQRIDRRSD